MYIYLYQLNEFNYKQQIDHKFEKHQDDVLSFDIYVLEKEKDNMTQLYLDAFNYICECAIKKENAIYNIYVRNMDIRCGKFLINLLKNKPISEVIIKFKSNKTDNLYDFFHELSNITTIKELLIYNNFHKFDFLEGLCGNVTLNSFYISPIDLDKIDDLIEILNQTAVITSYGYIMDRLIPRSKRQIPLQKFSKTKSAAKLQQ